MAASTFGEIQIPACSVAHHGTEYILRMTCLPNTYGDEILIHLAGRPPLKRIRIATRAGEDLWMHLAEER